MDVMTTTKNTLRTRALAQRAHKSRAQREDCHREIRAQLASSTEFAGARCVFSFISVLHEPDTRHPIQTLLARGTHVLVPRIVARNDMRAVSFPGWSALQRGPLGIPAPVSIESFNDAIDLAIVPGLAFTSCGHRLGYGAGFYDRWLAQHPAVLAIGLCYDDELIDDLPIEDHDRTVDLIVTDRRILKIQRA